MLKLVLDFDIKHTTLKNKKPWFLAICFTVHKYISISNPNWGTLMSKKIHQKKNNSSFTFLRITRIMSVYTILILVSYSFKII